MILELLSYGEEKKKKKKPYTAGVVYSARGVLTYILSHTLNVVFGSLKWLLAELKWRVEWNEAGIFFGSPSHIILDFLGNDKMFCL